MGGKSTGTFTVAGGVGVFDGEVVNLPAPFPAADLRGGRLIDPAPFLRLIFGPSGTTAGPGSHGNGPGSTNSAGCTKNQPPRPVLSPTCGHFVFLVPTARR